MNLFASSKFLIATLAVASLSFMRPSKGHAHKQDSAKKTLPCSSSETFSGQVKRGESYTHSLSGDPSVVFRLRAEHGGGEGWDIEIGSPKPDPDGKYRDWAWPFNPPFHGYNAQTVSDDYGFSSKDILAYGPREFRFPLTQKDAHKASDLYDQSAAPGPEFEAAMKELDSIPTGKGTFDITGSHFSPNPTGKLSHETFDWMKFKVTLVLPCPAAAK